MTPISRSFRFFVSIFKLYCLIFLHFLQLQNHPINNKNHKQTNELPNNNKKTPFSSKKTTRESPNAPEPGARRHVWLFLIRNYLHVDSAKFFRLSKTKTHVSGTFFPLTVLPLPVWFFKAPVKRKKMWKKICVCVCDFNDHPGGSRHSRCALARGHHRLAAASRYVALQHFFYYYIFVGFF